MSLFDYISLAEPPETGWRPSSCIAAVHRSIQGSALTPPPSRRRRPWTRGKALVASHRFTSPPPTSSLLVHLRWLTLRQRCRTTGSLGMITPCICTISPGTMGTICPACRGRQARNVTCTCFGVSPAFLCLSVLSHISQLTRLGPTGTLRLLTPASSSSNGTSRPRARSYSV
jgi:hypothetical protein